MGDEEGGSGYAIGLFHQLDEGELAGPVDGDEQIELALDGLHLGDVDMEEPDRVGFELLPGRLVAVDVRQPADAVALQAAVQRRARQVRDCCL
jgi:hypothetical protein